MPVTFKKGLLELYMPWLKMYPADNTEVWYAVCLKVVSVARNGRGVLGKHAKGLKLKIFL